MLEEKDLQAIKEVLNTAIDSRLNKSEDFILDEMGRVQTHIETKIDQLQKSINELKQYYKIDKLENESVTLLLQKIMILENSVEELKRETEVLKRKLA